MTEDARVPAKWYEIVIEDDAITQCGAYKPKQDGEAAHLAVWMGAYGARAGSERLRAHLYGNSDYAGLVASSQWLSVSDIASMSTYWYGWARFDFDRQHLDSDSYYYLGIETENYTESGTNFMGVVLDWPDPIHVNDDSTKAPARMEPYQYLEL